MANTPDKPRRGDIVAALDIGSSKVCCLIVEMQGEGSELSGLVPPRVLGIGYHRSRGIKGGRVFEPMSVENAIRAAVDKAERQADVSVDKVHVALNPGHLRSENFGAVVELGGGKVKRAHVDDLLHRGWDYVAGSPEAVLHALAVGYSLDEAPGIDEPIGYSGERLYADFHALVADLQPVRGLLGCIEDCYLSPVGVVAAPYASALATLRPQEAREGAAVIDLGGGTSSVAVMANSHFIYADSLSKGGNQVTATLEKRLGISWRDAELLKLQIGRGVLGPATYPQAAELVTQQYAGILLHLKQRLIDSGFALDASNYIVLTGGAALYHDVARLAADIFARPARLGAPLHAAGLPPQLASAAFSALWGVIAQIDRQHLELAAKFAGDGHGGGRASLTRIGHWLRRLSDPLGDY
jgi:cell division protein FtsA